jgi:hypothetical protein
VATPVESVATASPIGSLLNKRFTDKFTGTSITGLPSEVTNTLQTLRESTFSKVKVIFASLSCANVFAIANKINVQVAIK